MQILFDVIIESVGSHLIMLSAAQHKNMQMDLSVLSSLVHFEGSVPWASWPCSSPGPQKFLWAVERGMQIPNKSSLEFLWPVRGMFGQVWPGPVPSVVCGVGRTVAGRFPSIREDSVDMALKFNMLMRKRSSGVGWVFPGDIKGYRQGQTKTRTLLSCRLIF